jgi:hypothetical protein
MFKPPRWSGRSPENPTPHRKVIRVDKNWRLGSYHLWKEHANHFGPCNGGPGQKYGEYDSVVPL